MKRKERTRILVHCSNEFLTQWAQYFEQQTQFHVIEEPKNALTMLRMRESAQHSLFYLGEVLVSETRVKCRDTIGIGLIQGNELEKSYALAVMFKEYPGEIYVARKDSPMILGVTDGECYVASDVPAILK